MIFRIVAFLLILITTLTASSNCPDIKDLTPYGGHYYGKSTKKLTFNEAKKFAEQKGGYLAIPNNQAENDFISKFLGGKEMGWIGIYDPSFDTNYGTINSNRFVSIKNETISYKNFKYSEPNNMLLEGDFIDGVQKISPAGEHWVVIDAITGKWADVGNHFGTGEAKYYAIIEYEATPECFKDLNSDVTDTFTNKKCSTQIWDEKTGNLETTASNLDCQTDIYGNTFCPSSVSPCGEEWDYYDGSSSEKVGEVTDYIINQSCPDSSYKRVGDRCIREGYFKCDGNWQYFAENSYIEMTNWDPSGKIRNYGGGSFATGLRYKCTSSSSVRFEQYHKLNGSPIYGLVYPSLNLANSEQVKNFSETRKKNDSASHHSYYIPYFDTDYDSYSEPKYIYKNMNGMYSSYTKVGDIFTLKVENTYKNAGWTVRDIISGTVKLLDDRNIPFCPTGYEATKGEETKKGACKRTINYSYYDYLCKNEKNDQGYDFITTNPGGDCNKVDNDNTSNNSNELGKDCNSSTPPKNNCKRLKYTCQANKDRPCSFIDNKWQCSPFPCFGNDEIEVEGDIQGKNDKSNDGWNDDGSCSGQIYIFNGEDYRCRNSDTLLGLSGGGCCDKDKVFLGLIGCKTDEKKLAKKAKENLCVEVGEYCSKKIRLGFTKICVQKSKGNCCFSSKLAKEIQIQGRKQIPIGWGSGSSPECRGFTIDEFQKLDFSKIDLTNAIDIDMNANGNKANERANATIENIKNMYGSGEK